ncbi:IclR family transcriptional regulator [Georgenia ruanii]|uniref:Helix-turn-helix domain-containing protein n=1 Tax=Georgenia ruanii TaxID=348442 RepID=A0A7J9UYN8_9MICO|nr:IclR family transcriptional regulator [Georgenia ruanii]MPV89748.1 helix-turn-helix domain-containing protein [Georgenia ruanii]
MQQKSDPYRIEAVDRALTLLTLLADRGTLSVTEAGRELDVAASTAHRLLSTLAHRGFAVQGDRRLYHPGPELLGLGRTAAAPPLPERVRPYLEHLYAEVGETVHLMVRDGAEVRFADGIEGTQPLRVGLRTGANMPAYCTSGGKAMLADLDDDAVDALHPGGLTPWPGEQIDSLPALHRELAAVRAHRFGLNHDESEPGVTAIGASLGVIDGEHAALTVALPTARFATVDATALADRLLRACRHARRALTGAGDDSPN